MKLLKNLLTCPYKHLEEKVCWLSKNSYETDDEQKLVKLLKEVHLLFCEKNEEIRKMKIEIIICSAIKLPNGMIFRGHRHSDCIRTAHEFITWNGGIDPGEHHWNNSMSRDQGFITSRNRYVSRSEAMKLQLDAGIPSVAKGGYRGDELFSEDLY
jgi:hypothetical protein